MNCPICQAELESSPDEECPEYQNSRCPIYQADRHNNTHYYKYVQKTLTHIIEIEEIALYPFRIKNQTMYVYEDKQNSISEKYLISCFLFKFNQQKYIKFKSNSGGFDRLFQLPDHIKADTEDRLRERIKLLLLLS